MFCGFKTKDAGVVDDWTELFVKRGFKNRGVLGL